MSNANSTRYSEVLAICSGLEGEGCLDDRTLIELTTTELTANSRASLCRLRTWYLSIQLEPTGY
jgi:hypothetical protein